MRIQSLCKRMGDYMCLASCYSWIVSRDKFGERGEMIERKILCDIIEAYHKGILDDEITVLDGAAFLELCNPNNKYKVEKRKIITIDDIKEATPVRFDRNEYEHWVVVENGKIVFDSLDDSKCVKFGMPTTARIISKATSDKVEN